MNEKITLAVINSNNFIKNKINNNRGNSHIGALLIGGVILIAIVSFAPEITTFTTEMKTLTIAFYKTKMTGILK